MKASWQQRLESSEGMSLMGSRESSFHIEGLVYQRSVRSDGMFKEQQERQYYGQRREQEDGG